jgi:hypothetical protein
MTASLNIPICQKKYVTENAVFCHFSPIEFMQTSPTHLTLPRDFEMLDSAEV